MDEMPTDGFRHRPRWLLAVVGLVLAQAGFALAVLSPERTVRALIDDRPILSGRHPLHLYHGTLGAENFLLTGNTTCYDPNFQAGYPKTPVFDGGSRPAELFLSLAGGEYQPGAYKLGLFVCFLLIPVAFVFSGRGVGLPAGASVLAGVLGTLIGWSWPVRRLIDEGEFDFIMGGLCVIVFISWLVRYARWFGVESWFSLAAISVVGWYAHPVLWLGLGPVVIGYYIVLAPRRELAWHLGLLGVVAAGLAPNLWWLTDWGRYWWLRQPSESDQIPLPEWQAILGGPGDYFTLAGYMPLGGVLAVAGAIGIVGLWRSGCRCGAGLVLVSSGIAVAVARLLSAWPRVPVEAPERLAPLAAGFLALPAAFGIWKLLQRGRCAGACAVLAVGGMLFTAWCDGPERPISRAASLRTEPLAVGFSSEQEQLIAALREQTTPDARILWDETTDHRPGWNWTALLPTLTERAYLGGLDHDAGMGFSFCEMRDGKLNGRNLGDCTDADLARYCWWYNVGWVVCRSPAAADRWGKLAMAKPIARLKEGGQPVVIFALDRPRSFVLKGTAKWEATAGNRITLTDVVPDANGEVCLSLHHPVTGLRAYPSYVSLTIAKDMSDPMAHVCLRPHGPVPRITLIWENP